MGRPVYPHELGDPDFSWLVSNFIENNPGYATVEGSLLPVVFITVNDEFTPCIFPVDYNLSEDEVHELEEEL